MSLVRLTTTKGETVQFDAEFVTELSRINNTVTSLNYGRVGTPKQITVEVSFEEVERILREHDWKGR